MECKKIIPDYDSLQTVINQYQKLFKLPCNTFSEETCPICYCDFLEKKFRTVFTCGHVICTDCASSMQKILCPIGKCSKVCSFIENGFFDEETSKIYTTDKLSHEQELELLEIYTIRKLRER